MRAFRAITTSSMSALSTAVLSAALVLSACTSSSTGHSDPPSSSNVSTSTPVSTPVSTPQSSTSTGHSSSSAPAAPTTPPTVPADVPTIGHNSRPGEKPPVEPIAALAHTPAGAKAFAVFFIKTIDWGYATTSSTYMRHYFQQSCIECVNVAHYLDYAAKAGQHYVGARVTNIRFGGLSPDAAHGSQYRIALTVNVGASEVIRSNGSAFDPTKPYIDLRQLIFVAWHRGGWRVRFLANAS